MKMSKLLWVQCSFPEFDIVSPVKLDKSRSQALTQDLMDPNLRTRDRELTDIAKSISSLAELFKDLSVLVIDQGTLLDSVEYNIEQTAAHVQEAVRELKVAMRWVTFC
jgi:syntaxin 16